MQKKSLIHLTTAENIDQEMERLCEVMRRLKGIPSSLCRGLEESMACAKCQFSCIDCASNSVQSADLTQNNHEIPLTVVQDVDLRIEKLNEVQDRLKSYRNETVPFVSLLPLELISRIFDIYVSEWHNGGAKEQKPYGWTEVIRVCRLWREAALECPHLWQNRLNRRNKVIPSVSRLPPELLSEIFEIYVSNWRNGLEGMKGGTPYGWTQVTRVCRLWREVALECPRLWTQLIISSSDESSHQVEVLRRSKSCQLDVAISVDIVNSESPDILGPCLEQMYRIRQFHASGLPQVIQSIIPRLKISAPALRSLSLENVPPQKAVSVIPDFMFDGYTPSLRKLSLSNYLLNSGAPMLYNLRHLELCNQDFTELSISSLLAILGSTPLIEHVGLHFKRIYASNPSLEQGPLVNIGNLSRLELTANVDIGIYLLDRLSFPSSAYLQLHIWIATSLPDAHVNRLMSISAGSCGIARSDSLRTLNIRATQDYEFQTTWRRRILLMGWTEPVSWGLTSIGNESERFFWELDMQGPDQYEAVVKHAFKALSLKSLEVVLLNRTVDVTPDIWVGVLRHAKKLHTIWCIQWLPENLIRALSMDIPVEQSTQTSNEYPQNLLLPALSTIMLHRVTFGYGSLLARLETMLIQRRERGGEIRRLEFIKCKDVIEGDIEQLKGLVINLKWDGYTSYSEV